MSDYDTKRKIWWPLIEQILGRATLMDKVYGEVQTKKALAYVLATMPLNLNDRKEINNMMRKYKIELAINFDDDSRHKIALHMMRKTARTVLLQASLLSDGRDPQVIFESGDFFEGGTKESLTELSPLDETEAEVETEARDEETTE